jgi:hypothetical protein
MRLMLNFLLYDARRLVDRLETLHAEMHNRPARTRGKSMSITVTASVARRIWDIHQADPSLPQHEIARLAGVNQGRVSEVLAGKRT